MAKLDPLLAEELVGTDWRLEPRQSHNILWCNGQKVGSLPLKLKHRHAGDKTVYAVRAAIRRVKRGGKSNDGH